MKKTHIAQIGVALVAGLLIGRYTAQFKNAPTVLARAEPATNRTLSQPIAYTCHSAGNNSGQRVIIKRATYGAVNLDVLDELQIARGENRPQWIEEMLARHVIQRLDAGDYACVIATQEHVAMLMNKLLVRTTDLTAAPEKTSTEYE